MNDFWQGLTYGALGGAIVTLSLCIRIISFLINLHPLPAKATREQLMAEYGSDMAKYKKYSDAEVLSILFNDNHPQQRTILKHLSDDQIWRLITTLPKNSILRDNLELELIIRI